MTRHTQRPIAILTLAAFVAALCWGSAPVADAQQTSPSLARAESLFQVADFRAALDEVNALLGSGTLSGSRLRDAHVLEARCHVALGERDDATNAYCRALGVDAAWTPDPDFFTRDEVDTFEEASATCAGRDEGVEATPATGDTAWYQRPLVLGAAAGVAVIGLIALLAGGGGDGDGDGGDDGGEPLPDFPPPPE